MSLFGGGGGGRTRVGTKVFLNVYDLNTGPAQGVLYQLGCGLHHSGVEILGSEYSFASNVGIFSSTPKEVPNAVFREQVDMGTFEGGTAELRMALSELESDGGFGPSKYHLLRRNCNHFANALCWKLLKCAIPPHVNRLSDIGNCCTCLVPKALLEHAPVGDDSGPLPSGSKTAVNSKIQAFSGTGMKLGSTKQTMERQSLVHNDDLTDRRERARQAAVARMEQQQKQA